MEEHLEELLSGLVVCGKMQTSEAVVLRSSGRFVGHCQLQAKSLGECFLRLGGGGDRYIWEQSPNKDGIQNHEGDVEMWEGQPERKRSTV